MLSAGPIPHNSIHLLIITADFVALYRFYWICPFHYHFISEYKIVFSIYISNTVLQR